jgi:hypothetical protein
MYVSALIRVPDPGSRDRDVVLASAGLLGKTKRGVGNLEQGGNGERMRKGRSVYEQPGTKVNRVASRQRRVSKYVKGNKGKLTGNSKGRKNKGLRYNLCYELYMCI